MNGSVRAGDVAAPATEAAPGTRQPLPRGWRGHARAIASGRLSTGALKAAGSLGLALFVLRDGGRTVVLRFDRLRPVMQMQVAYNVSAADGRPVVGSVFLTIHRTGK